MYGLNWLLSNAQIELLAMDVSVTNYKSKRDKNKSKGQKGTTSFNNPSTRQLNKAAEEWKEKYSSGGNGQISINDIF